MITENRTLLAKADMVLDDLRTDGGLLMAEQAQKFMRLLTKEAVILGIATVVPMKAPKRLIEKMRFTTRIMRPGNEAQPLAAGDRVAPDLSKTELSTVLLRGEIRLTDEQLEDNIERGELRQTVMEMLGTTCARDMEELIVQGDTGSADQYLALLDGILNPTTPLANTVDALDTTLNKGILRDCHKTMPSEYMRDIKSMRFLTSVKADIDYRDSISDRVGGLSDIVLQGGKNPGYNGAEMVPVPMMPENIGTSNHCTDVLFCDPKNINVGIQRAIRLETDKDISAGVMKIVASVRMDVKWAEQTAVVLATNVKVA